ncbi:MAG: ADP-heptose--LPS heptosyltransferase, partial [Pseudomonadota bacterium]
MKRILIIKLGALGDFVQAVPSMQTIVATYSHFQIDLLTRPAFVGLAKHTGLFADIIIDTSPKWWQVQKFLALRAQFASRRYDFVYDLQTSARSSHYRCVLGFG